MRIKSRAFLVPLLVWAMAIGCAPAYHRYSGGHVCCKYCALPPLPYSQYRSCVCHSRAASKYLDTPSPTVDEQRSDAADSGGEPDGRS